MSEKEYVQVTQRWERDYVTRDRLHRGSWDKENLNLHPNVNDKSRINEFLLKTKEIGLKYETNGNTI